jgi:hypothetical protein
MSSKTNYSDVTARSSQMPRDSALLYPNKDPRGDDPPRYRGFLKLADGSCFWISAWGRTVKGETVVELRLTPKNYD